MSVNRRSTLARLALMGLGATGALRAGAALAETTQYTYDALGRIVLVVFESGASVQYFYDTAGNRTQVVRAATPPQTTFSAVIAITGTSIVNLRTRANTAGYTGDKHANIIFQVGSAVTITGSAGAANGGMAIDTGEWPTTLHQISLTLQVSGKAIGGGGRGGNGAVLGNGTSGGAGGHAVYCRAPMSIVVNSGGQLRGGGGGGGGGGGYASVNPEFDRVGGGGGGGFPNGAGGNRGNPVYDGDVGGATNGAGGTISGGGAGGAGETGGGGAGGSGGGAGAGGAAGAGAGISGPGLKGAGAGGAAGYAVRKNGHAVSVVNNGTIHGAVA